MHVRRPFTQFINLTILPEPFDAPPNEQNKDRVAGPEQRTSVWTTEAFN